MAKRERGMSCRLMTQPHVASMSRIVSLHPPSLHRRRRQGVCSGQCSVRALSRQSSLMHLVSLMTDTDWDV